MKRFCKALLALVMIGSVLASAGAILFKLRNMHRETYDILYELQTSNRDIRNTMLLNDQQMDDFLIDHQTRYTFDDSWMDRTAAPLAAHAMGGIDGKTYTNSMEAFEHNYQQGYRVFEVDFDLTEEYDLIASHSQISWNEMTGGALAYTTDNVRSTPLYGRYTAVDYRDVIDLMASHPDLYVITDFKSNEYVDVMLGFSMLVKYASEHAPQVLDRLIPQIYQMEMLDWIMSCHPFRSVIFTLYRTNWTPEQLLAFCEASGVGVVTIGWGNLTDGLLRQWKDAGLRVGIHTLNEEAPAKEFLQKGVDLIYTDFLAPEDFSR